MFFWLATVTILQSLSPSTRAKDTKASMYNNPHNSDIKFYSQKSQVYIYAHKSILAASSPVFNAMFYDDSSGRGASMSFIYEDYDQESVAAFLRYIYTEECPKNIEVVLNVLQMTKTYRVHPSFETACKNNLEVTISWPAFKVIEKLLEVDAKEMAELWWPRIESRIDDVIASEYFLKINRRTLTAFLERETLCYPEIDLFHAVIKWSIYQCRLQREWVTKKNQRKVLGDSIFRIRFLTMTEQQFQSNVVSSGVLTEDEVHTILEAMKFGHSGAGKYRQTWALPARNKRAWHCQYTHYITTQELTDVLMRIFLMLLMFLAFIIYLRTVTNQRQGKEQEKEQEAEDEPAEKQEQSQRQQECQHQQTQKETEKQHVQYQKHVQQQQIQEQQEQNEQQKQQQQEEQQHQKTQQQKEQQHEHQQHDQQPQQQHDQQQQHHQQQQQQHHQRRRRYRRRRHSPNDINMPD